MRKCSLAVLLLVLLPFLACDDDERTGTSGHGSGELSQVVPDGYHPTVSPDGQWIAYRRTGMGIVKSLVQGSRFIQLTEGGYDPDWSKTDDLVVFRKAGALYVVKSSTGEITHLITGGFDDDPCWSPLGHEIAVQSSRGILLVSYPEGDTSTLFCSDPIDSGCEGEGPTWSPDGQWLAFEDGVEIMKVPRGGGSAVAVVRNLRDVACPAWSPNGQWIAFSMAGMTWPNGHLWVTDARGVSHGLWQVTDGAFIDGHPTWLPDSRTIYFERVSVDSSQNMTHLGIWRVEFQAD